MIEYPYVCGDVETTGLDPRVEEIVEVTVTEFNMSGIGQSKSFLCRPASGRIPKEATDIHGITYDMVKDKPNYLKDGIREQIAGFVGDRTLVGHNINSFDIKFLKIKPRATEDTLEMSRRRFQGRSNKLKTVCARLNIEWDDTQSHRSGYDVEKTIQLYLKLKNFEIKEVESKADAPMFAANIAKAAEDINDPGAIGIVPTEKDKKLIATQAYSYSRIKLFKQCAFKWFMQYIKGVKQPDEDYLIVGKVVHKIAERSGEWCFRELFANKFRVLAQKLKLEISQEDAMKISAHYNKEKVTMHDYGKYLFENPKLVKEKFNIGLYNFIAYMDREIAGASVTIPAMPSLEDYEIIIQSCINQFKINDASLKNDIRMLASRFFRNGNFSLLPGDMVLTERRVAFDRDWKVLSDFYANNVYFRAIIDVIYYFGKTILIKDYKTSRTMEKQSDMEEDMQLITYVLMIYKFIPRTSYNKIILQVEYIRFGKIIELEINDVEKFVEKAMKWIADSVQDIEKEMLKTDGSAFAPTRNEYCHTCHIGGDGRCPLFNKNLVNNIEDPFNFIVDNIDDCARAWKRVEVNKAENNRLTKLCKSFVENCESSIVIDKNAILDFYTSKTREFDPVKAVKLLLKKGMSIDHILSFMSFPPSQFDKFLEYRELKLTDEEIAEISDEKSRTEFIACTEEQVKSKGYINS